MMQFKPGFCFFFSALLFCSAQAQTTAAFHGKPLLGWNSWDSYGMYPTQEAMLKNVEVMAKRLKPFGYTYFVIDAGWNKVKDGAGKIIGMSVNDAGLYIANPQTFPGGIKAVADRVHALGLKFGIHIMRGISRIACKNNSVIKGTNYTAKDIADTTSLCRWNSDNYGVNMSKPGAQEYYNAYINELVDWGVDFIKADDITAHPDEVQAVVKAIRQTGKPVVLSLSPGGDTKAEFVKTYNSAAMVRITKDIWDNTEGIERAFAAWKTWTTIEGRTFLLDMDMIPFGHLNLQNPNPDYQTAVRDMKKGGEKQPEHLSYFSSEQKYTFITLRALSASPLFMGGDLPTNDEFSFGLLTNKDMLACNQNGITGTLIYQANGIEVWKAIDRNGPAQGWLGIFNKAATDNSVHVTSDSLGFTNQTASLYNIWEARAMDDISQQHPLSASIKANGVLFCRYILKPKK